MRYKSWHYRTWESWGWMEKVLKKDKVVYMNRILGLNRAMAVKKTSRLITRDIPHLLSFTNELIMFPQDSRISLNRRRRPRNKTRRFI